MNIKNKKINADNLCIELTLSVYIDSRYLPMYNIVSGKIKCYHDISEDDDIDKWIIASSSQAMENSQEFYVEKFNIIEA